MTSGFFLWLGIALMILSTRNPVSWIWAMVFASGSTLVVISQCLKPDK